MVRRALAVGAAGHFNAEMMCKFQRLGTAHKLIQLLRDTRQMWWHFHHIAGVFWESGVPPEPPYSDKFSRD